MTIFKGFKKNHYRPEALIVERYITEEAIELCSNYLLEADSSFENTKMLLLGIKPISSSIFPLN